jgi:hypothetical protein
MFRTFILLLAIISYSFAGCPNNCNGHGTCGANNACICWDGFLGADCALRECPFSSAFSSNAQGTGKDVHYYEECGGKGLCDRTTGECICFEGYEGKGCRRLSCPNDCSGHGICRYLNDIEATYTQWDAKKIQKCVCDGGYFGADCSLRSCPYGVDPLTLSNPGDDYIMTMRVPYEALSHGYDAGTGKNAEQVYLKYTTPNNEVYYSSPFYVQDVYTGDGAANGEIIATDSIVAAFKSFPQRLFEDVTVSHTVGDTSSTQLEHVYSVTFPKHSNVGIVGSNNPFEILTHNGNLETSAFFKFLPDIADVDITAHDGSCWNTRTDAPCLVAFDTAVTSGAAFLYYILTDLSLPTEPCLVKYDNFDPTTATQGVTADLTVSCSHQADETAAGANVATGTGNSEHSTDAFVTINASGCTAFGQNCDGAAAADTLDVKYYPRFYTNLADITKTTVVFDGKIFVINTDFIINILFLVFRLETHCFLGFYPEEHCFLNFPPRNTLFSLPLWWFGFNISDVLLVPENPAYQGTRKSLPGHRRTQPTRPLESQRTDQATREPERQKTQPTMPPDKRQPGLVGWVVCLSGGLVGWVLCLSDGLIG